jgi:hypothetical protein
MINFTKAKELEGLYYEWVAELRREGHNVSDTPYNTIRFLGKIGALKEEHNMSAYERQA